MKIIIAVNYLHENAPLQMFDKVLNMIGVLNIPGSLIQQGSKYASALIISEF